MPQTLKSGTFYMMVGLAITMAIGYLAQVIVSRYLGPETYGLYGLVLSNVALIAGLIDPGISASMATFTAEQDVKNGKPGVVETIKAGLVFEASLSLVIIVITIIFFKSIATNFFSGSNIFVLIFLILTFIQGFYGLFVGVIQGLRELKGLAIVKILEQIILLILIIIIVYLVALNLISALIIQTITGGGALLLTILALRYYITNLSNFDISNLSHNFNWINQLPDIIKFAAPASFAAFSSSVVLSSGPALLNYLTNNNPGEQLGIFVVILTLARALNRIVTTFFRSAFPFLVYWNTRGLSIRTKQYTNLMSVALILGYLVLLLFSFFFGDWIIGLIYGNAYLEVATYLPLAILAFCMISLREVYKVSIYSIKYPGVYLIINTFGVFIYFVSIALGFYGFRIQNPIGLILASIGIANLFITIGSIILFRTRISQNQNVPILYKHN